MAPAAATVTIFTDPGCPFGFNAQRQDLQVRWHYGDAVDVRTRMIVLRSERGTFEGTHLTSDMLVANAQRMRDEYGMPMAVGAREFLPSTRAACKAFVGARLSRGDAVADALLRAVRVHVHSLGSVIDEPATLVAAAADAGIEAAELEAWLADDAVEAALEEDVAAARAPVPEALALPHKLARNGDGGGMRYTASSAVVEAGERTTSAPGFQPWAAYEVAIASAAPQLPRRAAPESVGELLAWAPYPLATAEVAAVRGVSIPAARRELEEAGASFTAMANDGYWAAG
ncbi:DsbA family protein [Conexibacter sp. CPCC 206217]|uniref:DsbA family protein n=1 Tax=Conexibacter sp. CPCC 206217 TaxID=3064574 RepID=UPI00272192DF|nr:DsbA family protein [Conexibacter sp. CPCC 206217]MDO8209059.1 DsbA family protein [Conexibacter sp. CPCC 206217]